MELKNWIEKARKEKKLIVTNDHLCPVCIETGLKPRPNAHKAHRWISENWYDNYKRKMVQ